MLRSCNIMFMKNAFGLTIILMLYVRLHFSICNDFI